MMAYCMFDDMDDAIACKRDGEIVVRIDDDKGDTLGYDLFDMDKLRETFPDSEEKDLRKVLKSYDGIGLYTIREAVCWRK